MSTSTLVVEPKARPLSLPARAPVLCIGLGLGWLFDDFFDGKALGVSAPLYAMTALAVLYAAAHAAGVRPAWRNSWLALPFLFFATMLFVRANLLLTLANAFAAVALFGLLLFFFAADRFDRLGLAGFPAVWGLGWANAGTRPAPVVAETGHALGGRGRGIQVGRVGVGALLAFPLLALFTALMSSADRVFADYVERGLRLRFLADLPTFLGHALVVLAVGWLAAGGLLWALERRPTDKLPDAAAPSGWLGFVESTTILALVDGLFLVFVWVQLRYLFNPDLVRTLPFEQYRDYARRGFFELVVISALTMTLILGLRWATRRSSGRQEHAFRLLSTLLVALSLVVLASALQRLVNWENAEYYVNTQIRIYVRWFTLWQALTFGWLLLVLWRWPDRFAIGGFVCALGFLATVNLLDPDADVAAYNLARRDELSVRYLHLLSDDAVPTLVAGLADPAAPPAVRTALRRDLAARRDRLEAQARDAPWPSFHLARWRALEALRGTGQIG
jgi:hypothetical protein